MGIGEFQKRLYNNENALEISAYYESKDQKIKKNNQPAGGLFFFRRNV